MREIKQKVLTKRTVSWYYLEVLKRTIKTKKEVETMKIKAYRVTGRELRKTENGDWLENDFELYTMNPKKVYREGIIVGALAVEPVKAVIDITDGMLLDATFEPYIRERNNKE